LIKAIDSDHDPRVLALKSIWRKCHRFTSCASRNEKIGKLVPNPILKFIAPSFDRRLTRESNLKNYLDKR
jgi:hypothetical protein